MNKQRVVITGMGVVSPIGNNINEFWSNAIDGRSGIKKINRFNIPDDCSSIAGMVDKYLESGNVFNDYSGDDRVILFARDAIKQAVKHSRVDLKSTNGNEGRSSLVLSSAVASMCTMERFFCKETNQGKSHILQSKNLHSEPHFRFDYINQMLSKEFHINGRSVLIPTGCAGCLDALAYSVSLIRHGKSDVVIAGASEAPITPLVLAAFNRIGAMSSRYNDQPEKASRPYDKDRDGFVLAEGAGALILESLDHALKRGANILAEISGVSSINNCYHMTNIPGDGLSIAKSCQLALDDANLSANEVDHINSHGSSTPQNDIAETQAFKKVFGKRLSEVTVTSNKSFLGHALAASNALEIILSVKTLMHQIVPPTINLYSQDSQCLDLNVVGNVAHRQNIKSILKNSSGFSGIHSSIVLKHPEVVSYA